MKILISNIFIIISIIFITLGVFGIFRYKNFYSRILIASYIDTVGFLFMMVGIIIRFGISWFSAKILLIVIIVILINPVVTHSIGRSAYHGGYRFDKEDSND